MDGLEAIKAAQTATRAKGGSKENGLTEIAQKAIEAAGGKIAQFGTGTVNRIGFSYFDKEGKPGTAWILPGASAKDVMGMLFDKGLSELQPAYEVLVCPNDQPVSAGVHPIKITDYHSIRHFGEAPPLANGELVEVYAGPNAQTGKPCYMFKKLKRS